MYWFYEILNRKNGLRYVGLTSNVVRREIRHFTDLKTGRHHNSFLQRDFNNQSADDFVFSVIMEKKDIDTKEAFKIEMELIEKYDSYRNGYNQNPGGTGGYIGPANGGSHLLQSDIYAINAALEFMSRPGVLLSEIFGVTTTTISRIKKGHSHLLYSNEYKALPIEKRRDIFNTFSEKENLLIRKSNKTIIKSKRVLTEFQVHCVFLNEERGRIVPLKRLARYFGVQGNTIDCILKHKTYQDFFYSYKTKTKEEKDAMASFLREKEEQTSRIAGTPLRATNHNISEKKI